jgi:hypothetical protein
MKEADLKCVESTSVLRSALGTCLSRLKHLDTIALALFPLCYHPKAVPLGVLDSHDGHIEPKGELTTSELLKCTERLRMVIEIWGLSGCYRWSPLINGQQVMIL